MTKRPNVMSFEDFEKPQVAEPQAEPEASIELPRGRKPVPDVLRTSMYFVRPVHDALRKIAFDERATISDLVNEGIDFVLKGRGYPSAEELKAKAARTRKRA